MSSPHRIAYDGFISYSHNDERQTVIARALHRSLERFARSSYFRPAVTLCRDETHFGLGELRRKIEAKLDSSRFLLLMASPQAAASQWVDDEVRHWLATKGEDTLLIVLTEGSIAWNRETNRFDRTTTTALPPAVLDGMASEPRWSDLSKVDDATDLHLGHPQYYDAVTSLAADLRGVDKDTISGEELKLQKRGRRRARGLVAAVSALALAAVLAGGWAIAQGEQARREQQQAAKWADRRTFTTTLSMLQKVEGLRDFDTVTDHPQRGLTLGIYLGWSEFDGRLHHLLSAMRAQNHDKFDEIFAGGGTWKPEDCLAAIGSQRDSRGTPNACRRELPKLLARAGKLPEFQLVQVDEAEKHFLDYRNAVQNEMPELTTERSVAFMVDVMTDHGPDVARDLYKQVRGSGLDETNIVDQIRQLSVKKRESNERAAKAARERRELFIKSPYLVDEPLTSTGPGTTPWYKDVAAWSRRLGLGPARTGAGAETKLPEPVPPDPVETPPPTPERERHVGTVIQPTGMTRDETLMCPAPPAPVCAHASAVTSKPKVFSKRRRPVAIGMHRVTMAESAICRLLDTRCSRSGWRASDGKRIAQALTGSAIRELNRLRMANRL